MPQRLKLEVSAALDLAIIQRYSIEGPNQIATDFGVQPSTVIYRANKAKVPGRQTLTQQQNEATLKRDYRS